MKKYLNKSRIYLSILILFLGCNTSQAVDFRDHPALVKMVDAMVTEDKYPQQELEAILTEAVIDDHVITSINRQSEALPWHKYRALFINDDRIRKGVTYWNQHEATLNRATQEYGVPMSIIVALIGVETHFGTRLGDKRVLDSLVTLTAKYPRRSQFFGKELRTFLNVTRAEKIAPQSVVGSYAGAVGIPQFMPSSYRAYAVDFNNSGKRDLANENEDAIGSVANYLKRHGWVAGQTIFLPISGQLPSSATKLVTVRAKPKLTAEQLKEAGVEFGDPGNLGKSKKMALLRLEEKEGERHFIGLKNFYAITRYNTSVNYAMVVVELSREINRLRNQ